MGATKNIVFENLLALLIAVEKKCTQEVAFKYLDKYMEAKEIVKKPQFKWTDEDIKDDVELRKQGIELKELGSYYGITESTMSKVVKRGLAK